MLSLLSPAKSLDFESSTPVHAGTDLLFEKEALFINKQLRKKNSSDLMELMHISEALANLNLERNRSFDLQDEALERRAAIFAFDGDVYKGLDAYSLSENDLKYAQNSLLILSGLYGMLRPFDLILPYRLEMGTKMNIGDSKNLYSYWKEKLTKTVNSMVEEQGHEFIVNLASKEYSKVLDFKALNANVVDIDFKEVRSGKLKVISFNAKRARGGMARQIVKNKIESIGVLKDCVVDGYKFDEKGSMENKLLFIKNE